MRTKKEIRQGIWGSIFFFQKMEERSKDDRCLPLLAIEKWPDEFYFLSLDGIEK